MHLEIDCLGSLISRKQPKGNETKQRYANKYRSASEIIDLTLPTNQVEIYNNLGSLPIFLT